MQQSRLFLVLGILAVLLLAWWLSQPHVSRPASRVYEPQSMYTYLLVPPSRIGAYQVVVSWISPDPTAVRGPYEDRNHGIVVMQFDLPYAPDINEVSVVFPSGEVGDLVFLDPVRISQALVVVDISPQDRAYVFVCSNALVYRGEDNIVRYTGLCSGPFVLRPGSYQEYNAAEVLPGVNP